MQQSPLVGAWRSLVARLTGGQEVPSSNLGAPTISLTPLAFSPARPDMRREDPGFPAIGWSAKAENLGAPTRWLVLHIPLARPDMRREGPEFPAIGGSAKAETLGAPTISLTPPTSHQYGHQIRLFTDVRLFRAS